MIEPGWFDRPAMMRLVLSTPNVLRQVNNRPRPFTFVFYVLLDGMMGYREASIRNGSHF
jgi:hypothetical protein